MSKNFNKQRRVINVINNRAFQALGHVNAIRLYTQPTQHSLHLQLHYIQHFSNAIIDELLQCMHSFKL